MATVEELLRQIQDMGPGAEDRIRAGFARRTALDPSQEMRFQQEARAKGLLDEVNDPTWDARAAFLVGRLPDRVKDPTAHGESRFKGLGDERLMLHLRGLQEDPTGPLLDTRTLTPPDPQLVNLWRVISGIMNR